MAEKIGIFGGSFNPVHNGHVKVALDAIKDLNLDRLLIIPAAVNPFKADAAHEAERGLFDRALLLRAAFNGVAKVTVDERELKRGGISYAIDTVGEITTENPGAEIFFLIGEDSLEGLPRWKEYERLKELCTFKVFPRTSESSTEIRARLSRGETIDDLVPSAVALFLRHGVCYAEDKKVVAAVMAGLERKEGFCPCRLPKNPEFFCPCEEFRGQLADGDYHGLCHCRLYLKP
jgi:nicotinate-nucleotide adenylyltransferase